MNTNSIASTQVVQTFQEPLGKETSTIDSNKTLSSEDEKKLQEAVTSVISMQAVSSLFQTMSSGEKSINKPSVLKEELKEMEQKEEQERRRRI